MRHRVFASSAELLRNGVLHLTAGVMALLPCVGPKSFGQIVFGSGSSPTLILNSDASQDTDGDNRFEDLSGVSGLDFRVNAGASRTAVTGSGTIISGAYTLTGSGGVISTTGQAGLELMQAGTGNIRSFQTLDYNPADNDATNESVTLELWFRPTDLTGNEVLWEDGGGTGMGLFLNGSTLELRKVPGSGVVASFDMSTLPGGGTTDFTQAVVQFNIGPNPDTASLYVNGAALPANLNATTGNNGADWSGSDPFGLGTLGGANMGGIGGGPSGVSSFEGEIAIFRAYRNDLLTDQQIMRNYSLVSGQAVTGQNMTFFTGASGTIWNNAGSWDNGLPVATDSMTVINSGSTVLVGDPGLVAHTLLVGSDISNVGATATAGAGALNLNGGDLTVTTNLNIGGAKAGNTGVVTNSGGTLNVGGDLNFDVMGSANNGNSFVNSGGTTTISGNVVFDPTNLLNSMGGNGGGGVLSISSGTFNTDSVLASATGSSTINLSGTGELVFTGGRVNARNVGTLTAADTSDLQFTLARATGFTPLTVDGTATLAGTSTITIGTAADPVAAPLAETIANNGITWIAATPADWSSGAPDGTAAFQTGATLDVLIAGTLSGTPASGNSDWSITIDSVNTNKLVATRTGADLNLGPVHAVIDATSGTVTRNAPITIAEAPATVGANASRLSVRDTGILNVNTDLVIGNVGGAGLVTVGTAGGGSAPDLNVSGNVRFGTIGGDFGGELAVDEGTADITGNILKADPGVGTSTVSVSGGTLTFNNLIDVDFFNLGAKQDQAGAFTLGAGEALNASQRMTIGVVGEGDFVNDGGTVTANQMVIGGADNAVSEGSADGSSYVQNSGTTTVSGFVRLGDDAINGADGGLLHIVGGTFSAGGGIAAAYATNSGQTDRSTIRVGGSGMNPTVIVSGGNLETANNHRGEFELLDGTVFVDSNNLIIGQGASSDSVTTLTGGVMDLRGQSGIRADSDINFNNGNGTLTINGGTVYASNDINMGSNNINANARTNRLELVSGTLFVRDDIRTRANGTSASGNKVDVIDIRGGLLAFGEGFVTGATDDAGFEGNSLVFETSLVGGTTPHANTYNVFDWTGGTIRGLDRVVGIGYITGSDANNPTNPTDQGIFLQKGGTLVLEAGTTTFDGIVSVQPGGTWQVIVSADDALGVMPNPNPNRAAFIEANGDTAVLSGNLETFFFANGWTLDLQGSGGAGDTTGANAVIFDAGSSLVWDSTAANWTMDTLPSASASGVVADVNDQFVIAESAEGSISLGTATLVDPNWTLSLATNDPNMLGLFDNQLVATRTNSTLVGQAAGLAIINATGGGIVQRNSDLLVSTQAGAPADAAALQLDAQGLNLSGSSNLVIGSGATGESFVNQNAGAVTVGGDLVFGRASGEAGGEYNLTGGMLSVTGNVVVNTVGENADINFDGGSATFGGSVSLEDLGVGRKAGSNGTFTLTGQTISASDDLIVGDEGTSMGVFTLTNGGILNVGDDVVIGNAAGSNGTFNVLGSGSLSTGDDLFVANSGTGVATFGDNTAGTQPTLIFNRADVGVESGSNGMLNITNGSYTGTGGLIVATNAGSMGTVVIGDGTANSNPVINISGGNTETANGGGGVITINSGTYNQNTNNIIVGQVDGSDATLNINGGAVNVTNQLRISNGGKGVVKLSGGLLTVNGVLDMGNNGGNDGGTLNVSGTGQLQLNNQLVVGNAAVQDAPSGVNLTGGRVNVTGNTTIGVTGEGSLTITGVQTGQQHDFGALFIVGSANNATSKGTVVIDMANPGDTVNTGQFRLGSNGQSSMELIEGTLNVSSSFNVAYSANSSAANGRAATLVIGDGTSSPTLNVTGGNFEAALAGTGTTTIKSGTYNQNSNNLIIGQNGGSEATFIVENGDVNVAGAGIIRIGNQSGVTAAFEVQNGTVDAGSLDFGGNAAAGASTNVGSYTQSGGIVTVGDFSVANGGNTIAVSGGSLMVNNMNFDTDALDTGSTFDFSGGTVTLGGNMDFRGGFTDVSVGGGTDINIGGNLLFDGGGTIANPNRFAISGSAATIDIGQNFTMTGTDQRILSFEALAASATPVSILDVLGDVSLGGTLELIGFDLLDWSTVFGGGSGTVTLINNQGANPVGGSPFQQTNGLVWNEGDAWIGDSQWSLSYLGGTGNDVVLNYTAIIIPEPSRFVLLAFGLTGLLFRRRRA